MQGKNPKTSDHFGQRLKAMRLQRGFAKADDFAEEMEVSRSTVYAWEDSPHPPHRKHWGRIARILGSTQPEVFGPVSGFFGLPPPEGGISFDFSETKSELDEKKIECINWLNSVLARAGTDRDKVGWVMETLRQSFPPTLWRDLTNEYHQQMIEEASRRK